MAGCGRACGASSVLESTRMHQTLCEWKGQDVKIEFSWRILSAIIRREIASLRDAGSQTPWARFVACVSVVDDEKGNRRFVVL